MHLLSEAVASYRSGFAAVGVSHSSDQAPSQWQGSTKYQFTSGIKNIAKNLTISLAHGKPFELLPDVCLSSPLPRCPASTSFLGSG
jgi:hypothetical protein